MFHRGRGSKVHHIEYVGLAKSLDMKALETVTFSRQLGLPVHLTNSWRRSTSVFLGT